MDESKPMEVEIETTTKPKPSISVYLTFLILALLSSVPVWFAKSGISEATTITYMGLLGAIGVSFDIVNFKHMIEKLKAEAKKVGE